MTDKDFIKKFLFFTLAFPMFGPVLSVTDMIFQNKNQKQL